MTRARWVVLILILFCGQVSVGVLNLVYTNHVDRQWCGLLVALDDGYNAGTQVPQTDIGRRLAAAVHERRVNAGC